MSQTFRDLEVILVDDNAPEGRVAREPRLQRWLNEPRIRLIEHDTPRNAARARNCGLQAARGDWITYLDDDDAYLPEKIEKQWKRAQVTNLPIGLCGRVYRMGLRSRISGWNTEEISGEDLLLSFPPTGAIFHRRTAEVRFDESLDAGEDCYFFLQLVQHLKTKSVFNVREALLVMYPQPVHLNLNGEGLWKTAEAVYRDFALSYGEAAAKTFMLRARLGYHKLRPGGLGEMLRISFALIRQRGWREFRPALNGILFKVPWLRRWLVS
jgi:glycosyltransferase involved in cell wall biosynthesis